MKFDDYIVSIGDIFLVHINGVYTILICTGVSERKNVFRLTSTCYLDKGDWIDYSIINDYEYFCNLKSLFSGQNIVDYTIIDFKDNTDSLYYYLKEIKNMPELFL